MKMALCRLKGMRVSRSKLIRQEAGFRAALCGRRSLCYHGSSLASVTLGYAGMMGSSWILRDQILFALIILHSVHQRDTCS